MTAPVRTRPAPARRAPRTAPAARPRASGRSPAAQRAYSRKSQRSGQLASDPLSHLAVAQRVPFVALIIGLLGLGLVATLWLSTNSAEDSYQLSSAQKTTRLLTERVEALHRDVATMDSAAALAQHATQLGMVPTPDVARLLVAPNGTVTVVGKPAPAVAAAAPLPAQPAPEVLAPIPTPVPAAAPPAAQPPALAPASGAQAPAAPAPAVGAPTPPPASVQAHSEQIQPGPVPAAAGGGA